MDDIDKLIQKINKRPKPQEAYELEQEVLAILNNENVDEKIKKKILSEAYLEPLSMMASCYEPNTQK